MTGFYRAFEERHRGPRSLIKQRLQFYSPFLEQLADAHGRCSAIDLGCGRGEWLELLQDMGFEAHGFDLDGDMLAACRELGLAVEKKDAVQALQALPDESQTLVSAFHLVEHIPFEAVRILVEEALRILKPGGLLILETPNAENLVVGTSSFYLDPTHVRPVPPPLLEFLTGFCGFARSTVVRLQETASLAEGPVSLLDVLEGVSPDYAVIAQKQSSHEQLTRFDPLFEHYYGVTLDSLAARYDERIERSLSNINDRISSINDRMDQTAEQYQRQLLAIYASTSWKLTAPVRAMGKAARWSASHGAGLTISLRFRILCYAGSRPGLRLFLRRLFGSLPGYRRAVALLNDAARPADAGKPADSVRNTADLKHQPAAMSPRARRIFNKLQAAIGGKN